jgi:two-component system sensor histidine kinase UhpB
MPTVENQKQKKVLRRPRSLYRLLADNVTDVIWVSDLNARIVYISPSVERQSGYSPDEIVGQRIRMLSKKDYRRVTQTLSRRANRKSQGKVSKSKPLELEVVHKDGHKVWTETYWSTLRDRSGRTVGLIGAVRDITERKEYENALKRSESQLRMLSQRILQIQEDERGRIARDLHDQLGQELVFLKMKAQSLAEQMSNSSDRHDSMVELLNLIDQTRATSHRIALSIRPGILDNLGLVQAVQWYAEEFEQRTSVACFVRATAEDVEVPESVATAGYRILQEALTNVCRHSRASEAHIDIKKSGKGLILRISDNGVGFDSGSLSEKNSLGLLGMRERARLVGGSVKVTSRCSAGTQVVARLPLGSD